jgi:hypothetical protein
MLIFSARIVSLEFRGRGRFDFGESEDCVRNSVDAGRVMLQARLGKQHGRSRDA